MRNNIVNLINSGITAHTVAVDTGLPRNTVYRIFSGETELSNVKFGTMEVLNEYYSDKFGYVGKVIEDIERGRIEVTNRDPDFYEMDYVDGPSSEFIIHAVEGHEELEVFFAERDFVQELKRKIYDGETEDLDHDEMELNEYDERFDYDAVVAYRIDGEKINWV